MQPARELVIGLDAGKLSLTVGQGGDVVARHGVPLTAHPALDAIAPQIRALGPEVAVLGSPIARAVAVLANDFDARRPSAPDVTRVAVHRLRAILARFHPSDLRDIGDIMPIAASALDTVMEVLGIDTALLTGAPGRRP